MFMKNYLTQMTINNLLKIIAGFLIVLFIFWNKLLRTRPDTFAFDGGYYLIISIGFIFVYILLIIIYMKMLLKINNQTLFQIKLEELLKKPFIIIIINLFNSPKYLYDLIVQKFSPLFLIEKPLSFFTVYIDNFYKI